MAAPIVSSEGAQGTFELPGNDWLAVSRIPIETSARLGDLFEEEEEEPAKRRRGLAGTLIDAALFATAVSYQLWKNAP